MKKMIFYKRNGEFYKEKELTLESIEQCHGQLIKCKLINGEERVGYADVFRCSKNEEEWDGEGHDFIYLWTWKNLNEATNTLVGNENEKNDIELKKVNIDEILKIESILHSGPRWGGKLTNKFFLDVKK